MAPPDLKGSSRPSAVSAGASLPTDSPLTDSRIGLLGGAFNPPHQGHLYICQEAKNLLALDEVHLLVTPNHPTKPAINQGYQERLKAVAEFIKPYPWLRLNRIEEQITGTNYSYKTLEKLAQWAKAHNNKAVFLCGVDAFCQLTQWQQPNRILASLPFAVFERDIPHSPVPHSLNAHRVKWQELVDAPAPAWAMLPSSPHPAASSKTNQKNQILAALEEGKAINPVAIDIKSSFADWMVIAEGRSYRHLKALAQRLVTTLKQKGIKPKLEGTSDWLLVDAGNAIVHLFHPSTRKLYNLEELWRNPEAK